MSELLQNADFWYIICVSIIILVTVFGIKYYLKKELRKSAEKEKNHAENNSEN